MLPARPMLLCGGLAACAMLTLAYLFVDPPMPPDVSDLNYFTLEDVMDRDNKELLKLFPERKAWLVLHSDSYIPLLAAMTASLRRSGTRYPLLVVCAVDDQDDGGPQKEGLPCNLARLVHQDGVVVLPMLSFPPTVKAANPYYLVSFNKIQYWRFGFFDRVVSLDSDLLIRENIDDLHDFSELTGIQEDCVYREMNGGVVVMEPAVHTWEVVWNAVHKPDCTNGSWTHCDQTMFQCYSSVFPGLNVTLLNNSWGSFVNVCGPNCPDATLVHPRIAHFGGKWKPPSYLAKTEELCATMPQCQRDFYSEWYEVYDDTVVASLFPIPWHLRISKNGSNYFALMSALPPAVAGACACVCCVCCVLLRRCSKRVRGQRKGDPLCSAARGRHACVAALPSY